MEAYGPIQESGPSVSPKRDGDTCGNVEPSEGEDGGCDKVTEDVHHEIEQPPITDEAAPKTEEGDQEPECCRRLRTALQLLRAGCSTLDEYQTALKGMETLIANLIKHPTLKKFQMVKTTNATFNQRIWRHPGAQPCTQALGFVPYPEESKLVYTPTEQPRPLDALMGVIVGVIQQTEQDIEDAAAAEKAELLANTEPQHATKQEKDIEEAAPSSPDNASKRRPPRKLEFDSENAEFASTGTQFGEMQAWDSQRTRTQYPVGAATTEEEDDDGPEILSAEY